MKSKIIAEYIVALALSIGLNLEIYNPANIRNPYIAIVIQVLLIIIFIAWSSLRGFKKNEDTLSGPPMVIYTFGLIISIAVGIILSFTSGTEYCRLITGVKAALWDRSYVVMKLFSIHPFFNIPKFIYILIGGYAPNIDYDYFQKNS